MQTADVIDALRNHRQICAKIAIVENTLQHEQEHWIHHPILSERLKKLMIQRNNIEQWLRLLPREERFLVQTHLVDGLDWAKTIVEYEKRWGVSNGRSERTLKRIQAKAVDRIVAFINELHGLLASEVKEIK